MKRGIYLVANQKSEKMAKNLIYSIRSSGCTLPIRLIHFGGDKVQSPYILKEVQLLHYEDFSDQAKKFIESLRTVLTDCPLGYLYRYLAWFSDWDEFIYTDNDVVALSNWELFFDHLQGNDLVHADEEYITEGKFNYDKPDLVQQAFGETALESAVTAGHIAIRKHPKMLKDISKAIEWFKQNPHIPKKHDQSLLHIASLIGNWRMVNLCKPPYNWLSSWSGDYRNVLELIHAIQERQGNISHLHYSGGAAKGDLAIHDLLFSVNDDKERLSMLSLLGVKSWAGVDGFQHWYSKGKSFLSRRLMAR